MSVQIVEFGTTKAGRAVQKLLLQQGGMEAEIITFGATLTALRVPSPKGEMVDVVLGGQDLAAYEARGGTYMGAVVGRYANRIGSSTFTLDGEIFVLPSNEGTKQLPGGAEGFAYRVFELKELGESGVRLAYHSADGEEGFPGSVDVNVIYILTDRGLEIRYMATADRPTVINLTNHSYFNLNGGGNAMGHRLWIGSEDFVPVDADSLPVARAMPVAGTPFDFRTEKAIGQDIEADDEQLHHTSGYDHSYLLPGLGTRLAARLTGDQTGIVMETWTDQPAVQLYSGNYLVMGSGTKSGQPYLPRQGICLETQVPPDSPNHQDWYPQVVLRPGERYEHMTEYRFFPEK